MPRRARFCPAGFPVHLIQRGNNRQTIFTCDDDLAAYAHWLAVGAERFGVWARLWSPHALYLHLGSDEKQRQLAWRKLIKETLGIEVMAKVRHFANTGLVLGTETFREQVHRLRNRGPKLLIYSVPLL